MRKFKRSPIVKLRKNPVRNCVIKFSPMLSKYLKILSLEGAREQFRKNLNKNSAPFLSFHRENKLKTTLNLQFKMHHEKKSKKNCTCKLNCSGNWVKKKSYWKWKKSDKNNFHDEIENAVPVCSENRCRIWELFHFFPFHIQKTETLSATNLELK